MSVQVGELLLLDDLGDRASGASVLASATGDAGILVSDGGDVLELQNASGAGDVYKRQRFCLQPS